MSDTPPADARQLLQAAYARFQAIEARAKTSPGYALRAERSDALDELQDLVGLSGKMVTEADILKRTGQLLAK